GVQPHLVVHGIGQEPGQERKREEGNLAAEVRDGERGPQPHEIGVAPQSGEHLFFFPMRGCASRVARSGKSQSFWPSRPASKFRRAIGPTVSLCRSAARRENDDPRRALESEKQSFSRSGSSGRGV